MEVVLDHTSVLIVGDGQTALTCSHTLITEGRGRYRLAGVVPPADFLSFIAPPAEGPSTIPHWVVVALDDRRGHLPVAELVSLRFEGVKVQDAPSFLEDMARKIPVRSVRPGDLLFATGFHFSRPKFWAKTIGEWLIALVLMIVVAPVVAIAALAILLETGRPIFFRQVRVGLGGRRFRVNKLRTMYRDAEKSGPRFATLDDDRITPVGRFLRRTRIDELPQLWNVLCGEMALVGPRPERPEFVEGFKELIPYFNFRHSVRPGVTGWAQVSFGYTDDANGTLEKLSYDLFYIKHHSLLFDLRVLVRTIKTVFGREGR